MSVMPSEVRMAERRQTFAFLRRDFQRYFQLDGHDRNRGLLGKIRIFLDAPGLQAVMVYRFGSWVDRTLHVAFLRRLLKLIYYILDKLCIIFWGIHIDERARIGGGLYIGHYGGVLIGPVQMGCDCNIAQRVTIGLRADGVPGVPVIGDRVWIGANSVIFGNVRIGDGVTIGPLTVVSRSLPPQVLVMGNPMRVLRRNYDNSAEIYGKQRTSDDAVRPDDLSNA